MSEACIGNHSFYASRCQEEVWFCILCFFLLTFYNLIFFFKSKYTETLCLFDRILKRVSVFTHWAAFLLFKASVIWLARLKRSIRRVLILWYYNAIDLKTTIYVLMCNCRTFSSNYRKKLLPITKLAPFPEWKLSNDIKGKHIRAAILSPNERHLRTWKVGLGGSVTKVRGT